MWLESFRKQARTGCSCVCSLGNGFINLFISSKTSNLCGILSVENSVPTPLTGNECGKGNVVYVRVGMYVYSDKVNQD